MSNLVRSVLLGAAALIGVASLSPARADFILSSGTSGNQGTDNVIFNACSAGAQQTAGNFLQGCLNTSQSTFVDFTSTDKIAIGAGGQAVIVGANNTTFDNIKINFDTATIGFQKLIFNINAVANGTASFTVNGFNALGQAEAMTFNESISRNGSNFFTFTALNGEVASNFTINSTVQLNDISDLGQIRIGQTSVPRPPQAIPEPASLVVLGGTLTALGLYRARRNRRLEAV